MAVVNMRIAPMIVMAGVLAGVQPVSAQVPGADTQVAGPSTAYAGTSGDAMETLHAALNLNAQQDAAWRVYRASTSLTLSGQSRRQAASRMFPGLDAPHRIDLVEAEMRQELADVHNQSVALKAFYAVLTPDQRRTFDQRTLPAQDGQNGQ